MRKNQTPDQSYENFCKAFAGVFKKHAFNKGTYHTCYIRGAIDDYVRASSYRRHYLMEDATAEDACGYRIARALLVQGWDEDIIYEHSKTQQEYIDELNCCCIYVMRRAGFSNDDGFARDSNGIRYAWLVGGGVQLIEWDDPEQEDD